MYRYISILSRVSPGLRLLEHEERAERQVRLLLRAGEGREQQALARAASSGDPDLVLQILLYLRHSDKYKSKSSDFLLLIRPVPFALNLYLRVRAFVSFRFVAFAGFCSRAHC